jgi:hypothetical protein
MAKESEKIIVNFPRIQLGYALWSMIVFLHIALIPIYLGIWSTVPSFINTFSNWIHLVMGLYLVIRFHPFQSNVNLYTHDLHLVFSAGLFMLQALVASVLLTSHWGKEITAYLSRWGGWVESLPFVAPLLRISSAKGSVKNVGEVSPNPTTSTLGGSTYTLVEG